MIMPKHPAVRVFLSVFALLLCVVLPYQVGWAADSSQADSSPEMGLTPQETDSSAQDHGVVLQEDESTVREEERVSQIPALYGEYDRARYGVRFELTETAAEYLHDKLFRYWYLLLYTSTPLMANSEAPILQFGFFSSRQEAQEFVDEYQSVLPQLQVVTVSAQEHRTLLALVDGTQSAEESNYYWLSPRDTRTDASHKALLDHARGLYVDRDYARALAHYRVLALVAEPKTALWALELKALNYERLRKHPQAIHFYRKLLREYPDSQASDRVTQRVRALETAADFSQASRRPSSYGDDPNRWHARGVVGQFYRYVSREGKHFGQQDVLSMLVTNVDAHAGFETPDHQLDFRIQGYHLYDDIGGVRTDTRLRRLHLNYTHKDTGVNVIGGRQRDFRTGSFASFDGITIKYPLHEKLSIAASYGEPVTFTPLYDDLDHRFYSVQARYDLSQQWRFSSYVIHQTLFGETDRLAYGGEVKYLGQNISSYLNVDYDHEFAELNNLLLGATYRFSDSHVSARYGRQRSPFLSATNILISQPQLDVQDYLDSEFNRGNLLYRALLRTSLSEFGSLSYHRRIDSKMHISTDVYRSILSDMPIFQTNDSGQTFVVVEKGDSYHYTSAGVQLMVMDFLGMNDTATMGLRLSDSSNVSAVDLSLTERLRFGNSFSATPKLALRYSENKNNDDNQARVRGSLELQYRPWRNAEFRLEVGSERFDHLADKNSITSTYFTAGYQARF